MASTRKGTPPAHHHSPRSSSPPPVTTEAKDKGTLWRNVLCTQGDPVPMAAKQLIPDTRKNCCFCSSGAYDGLNHVVSANTSCDTTTAYYLAPACTMCNKSYGILKLRERSLFVVPSDRKTLTATKFYVMQY
ncbi:hypothetical protein Pelo_6970 [Pelomyxa schiedti]|nr:hypothetical protein Pelo_6970 [Pelomyxa schiedti]